jgi:membrane protein implicated in regulation of membrane protease activity
MILWEQWWVWMSGAVLLATLEVLAPGYIFLGFAMGAFALGLLLLLQIPLGGIATTILVFAVLSLIAYLLMRRVFGLKTGSVKIWDRDIND